MSVKISKKIVDKYQKYKKDIPKLFNIKNIIEESEWPAVFSYPISDPKADYYVEYSFSSSNKILGSVWLLEASTNKLHRELKQLEESAEVFKRLNVKITNYLVVLDSVDPNSSRKYKLKSYVKPLKKIFERGTKDKEFKINSKIVFLIYRKDFKLLNDK